MRRLRIEHAHPIVLHPDIHQLSGSSMEVLDRFEHYAINFIANGGKGKLVIFLNCTEAAYQQLLARKYSKLLIFRIGDSGTSIAIYVFRAIQIIRKQKLRPSVLIAGDLKRGLIASIFLKALSGFRLRNQASIHGIPFGFRHEESKKIIRFIPWIYLVVSLRFVDSIRIVSIHLQELMQESFKIRDSKLFIAPIPVIRKPYQLDKSSTLINIGIVGRLHPERGIPELLRILNTCLRKFPDTRVTFFGSGELFGYIDEWRLENSQFHNIELRGHVSPNKLLEEWPQITHLISAAPTEGYGLTVREALLSGSVVIAKTNRGTRELKNRFFSGIYLYKTEQDACEMLMQILNRVDDFTYCSDAHRIQAEIDTSSINLLTNSWIH